MSPGEGVPRPWTLCYDAAASRAQWRPGRVHGDHMRSACVVVVAAGLLTACDRGPHPLPESDPTYTVCDASRLPGGQRVRIAGELFDHAPDYIHLIGECPDGTSRRVMARLRSTSEDRKLQALSGPSRAANPRIPGDPVTIEATTTLIGFAGQTLEADRAIVVASSQRER
jgi:hypothetical protein